MSATNPEPASKAAAPLPRAESPVPIDSPTRPTQDPTKDVDEKANQTSQQQQQQQQLVGEHENETEIKHDLTVQSLPIAKPDSDGQFTPPAYSPPANLPAVIHAARDQAAPRPRRNLVLCFDGTGDQFDKDNSNIVQLFRCLRKGRRHKQLVYYQAGLGTYNTTQSANKVVVKTSEILDMAVASGLGDHVRAGYQFLMQNYIEGDKICLFGFSRGAYTARALAGMLHKVGLLPKSNHQQVPFAYRMYKRDDKVGWKMSGLFKKVFSIDVQIEFIGVWDTVSSVGFIPRVLPFHRSNTAVRYFRHALSLDERRAKFKASHWLQLADEKDRLKQFAESSAGAGAGPGTSASERSDEAPATSDKGPASPPTSPAEATSPAVTHDDAYKTATTATSSKMRQSNSSQRRQKRRGASVLSGLSVHHSDPRDEAIDEVEFEMKHGDLHKQTDVKEVWFAGCHCDVGGGAVPNETRHSLSRIPLRWMIREAFLCDTGILFETDGLIEMGLDVETLYPVVLPRSLQMKDLPPLPEPKNVNRKKEGKGSTLEKGSLPDETRMPEDYEDYYDSLSPINDMLAMKKAWWTLEVIPIKEYFLTKTGEWEKYFGLNLGRHRAIRQPEPILHRSVLVRQQKLGYRIKSRLNDDTTSWKMTV